MKKLLLLASVTLLFAACVNTKVVVNSIYPSGIYLEELNLSSVMIGPVWQPVLPLLDAAPFNEKTNKIAGLIMDEEMKRMGSYKTSLVNNLQRDIKPAIHTAANFNEISKEPYLANGGIQIDNKNFPVVFFSEGDINLVDFGKGKNIHRIFKEDESLKENIAKTAKDLEVNNLMVSYNRLAVIGVGPFGTSGTIRLESYLFLYDHNGDLMMDAYGWMKPQSIKGKEINDYSYQLDQFDQIASLMSQKLSSIFK